MSPTPTGVPNTCLGSLQQVPKGVFLAGSRSPFSRKHIAAQAKRSTGSGDPGPSKSNDKKAGKNGKPSAKKAVAKDAATGSVSKGSGPQQSGAATAVQAAAPPTSHLLKATSIKARASAGKASTAAVRQASSPQAAPQVAMDAKWEVPKITKVVAYPQLLEDIRMDRVEEVKFFQMGRNVLALPGKCLVVYRNGTVGEATIDQDDMRVAYAMETHGVTASKVGVVPLPTEINPRQGFDPRFIRTFSSWFGLAAIGLVYLGTYIMRQRQGDADDREKLREKAKQDRRERERQTLMDDMEGEILKQHGMGRSATDMEKRFKEAAMDVSKKEILKVLARAGITEEDAEEPSASPEEELGVNDQGVFYNAQGESQLADEEAYRQKLAADVKSEDPNAQAEEMLKMKTVRIKRAMDPERQRRIREAQRQLRGVKLQYSDEETIFFDDVAGIGDAKFELQEVVDFFTRPARFKASGSKVPRGVLLCGPPGTGKTLLARAVAGEAGVAFLSINASEFVEMFVGVGAARVRDLFSTARSMAPAILFVDEIDSVGRTRGGAQGNDERDQTLNQLLTEMDGFSTEAQVIVMAASNRKDVLDSALIRPGRFDRIVYVDVPDFHGRIDILRVHLDRREWDAAGIDLHALSLETRNYSGARLANLVNMAATAAGQRAHSVITMEDMERALELERLGPTRSPYSDVARRRLALVEGATSVLATLLPAIEPVTKATIVVRETYPLGHTVVENSEQRELTHVYTRRYLEEQMLLVLAGRAAEEAAYGAEGMSTLCQRRVAMARRIANKMVVSNAMTSAVGPRLVAHPDGPGDEMDLFVTRFIPVDVAETVDRTISEVMTRAYTASLAMVRRNFAAIEAVADLLMEKNTVNGDEVRRLVLKHGCAEDLAFREKEVAPFM
ncbi:FTSHI2 [Auxenochlorella protothecoides x Auxenochlorella symbiontica]